MSRVVRYLCFAVRRKTPSMSGSGEVILWVFLLRSLKSTTVRSSSGLVFNFGIRSIGTVFPEGEISHRPDFK